MSAVAESRWGTAATLAVPALVAFLAYRPILGAGLTGEDLGLLRGAADASPLSYFAPGGGAANNPYWRPVWHLFNRGVLEISGGDPLACARPGHAASLLLHATNAALVAAVGLPLLGSRIAAGLAGILFALSPGPVAAVAWFAAANKLLTVAFGLAAILASLRFGERGGALPLGLSLALAFLALGSSELSYGLVPALGLAACLSAPDRRVGWRRGALLAAPLLAAIAVQALLLQPAGVRSRALAPGGALSNVLAAAHNEAGYLSVLVGGPVLPSDGLATLLAAALFASAFAGPRARFLGAWLLLAPFPTVLTTVVPFHSALGAAPLALLAASPVARLRLAAARFSLGFAACSALPWTWTPPLRDEVHGWVSHSREVLGFAREVRRAAADLSPSDTVRLANVPVSFDGALLALAGGLPTIHRIEFLETKKTCFLPPDFAWPAAGSSRVFEFARTRDGRTEAGPLEGACAGKRRASGPVLFHRLQATAGFEGTVRLLQSNSMDPEQTLLVEGNLPLPSEEASPEPAEILESRPGPDRLLVRVRVAASRPGMLVLFAPEFPFAAAPDPRQRLLDRDAFLRIPRGFAEVGGERVPLLPANGLYRAAPVPAGEHEVRLVYTL
ncbi:MAG TPA: hypothetical protein VFI25_03115 [Planctomycetota bacterium]|nr:hypothetical protein [Planctomycetota bacterium]